MSGLDEALAALRWIAGGDTPRCENYTSGIGACFTFGGRSLTAKYAADRPCAACVAHSALAAAAPPSPPTGGAGAAMIAAERQRQKDEEGWTLRHDILEHEHAELLAAARCYRTAEGPDAPMPPAWPWEPRWWKPKNRLRNLVRAGALVQAQLDITLPPDEEYMRVGAFGPYNATVAALKAERDEIAAEIDALLPAPAPVAASPDGGEAPKNGGLIGEIHHLLAPVIGDLRADLHHGRESDRQRVVDALGQAPAAADAYGLSHPGEPCYAASTLVANGPSTTTPRAPRPRTAGYRAGSGTKRGRPRTMPGRRTTTHRGTRTIWTTFSRTPPLRSPTPLAGPTNAPSSSRGCATPGPRSAVSRVASNGVSTVADLTRRQREVLRAIMDASTSGGGVPAKRTATKGSVRFDIAGVTVTDSLLLTLERTGLVRRDWRNGFLTIYPTEEASRG